MAIGVAISVVPVAVAALAFWRVNWLLLHDGLNGFCCRTRSRGTQSTLETEKESTQSSRSGVAQGATQGLQTADLRGRELQ